MTERLDPDRRYQVRAGASFAPRDRPSGPDPLDCCPNTVEGGFDRKTDLESIDALPFAAIAEADPIIEPERVSVRLNAMNTLVGADVANASELELVEFSTVNPGRPRRVGVLVSFPRESFDERRVDLDAALRSL
ncbi:hypothetical protein ACKVEX_09065 [Rhodocyclaceae bacterium SMB388]